MASDEGLKPKGGDESGGEVPAPNAGLVNPSERPRLDQPSGPPSRREWHFDIGIDLSQQWGHYDHQPHDDTHDDSPHSDVSHWDNPHEDQGHWDSNHNDQHSDHEDVQHFDEPHHDTRHEDTGHDDTGHQDSFGDVHGDEGHDDSAHDDTHDDHNDYHYDQHYDEPGHNDDDDSAGRPPTPGSWRDPRVEELIRRLEQIIVAREAQVGVSVGRTVSAVADESARLFGLTDVRLMEVERRLARLENSSNEGTDHDC